MIQFIFLEDYSGCCFETSLMNGEGYKPRDQSGGYFNTPVVVIEVMSYIRHLLMEVYLSSLLSLIYLKVPSPKVLRWLVYHSSSPGNLLF